MHVPSHWANRSSPRGTASLLLSLALSCSACTTWMDTHYVQRKTEAAWWIVAISKDAGTHEEVRYLVENDGLYRLTSAPAANNARLPSGKSSQPPAWAGHIGPTYASKVLANSQPFVLFRGDEVNIRRPSIAPDTPHMQLEQQRGIDVDVIPSSRDSLEVEAFPMSGAWKVTAFHPSIARLWSKVQTIKRSPQTYRLRHPYAQDDNGTSADQANRIMTARDLDDYESQFPNLIASVILFPLWLPCQLIYRSHIPNDFSESVTEEARDTKIGEQPCRIPSGITPLTWSLSLSRSGDATEYQIQTDQHGLAAIDFSPVISKLQESIDLHRIGILTIKSQDGRILHQQRIDLLQLLSDLETASR